MRVEQLHCRTDLPEGWLLKQSITLLAPDGQANLIASSEPLDPTLTTEQYARVQGDLLRREFPGFEEHDTARFVLRSGQAAVWRTFSWTPPDGVRVTQLQVYACEPGRGYTTTATSAAANWQRVEATFLEIIRTLAIGPDEQDR